MGELPVPDPALPSGQAHGVATDELVRLGQLAQQARVDLDLLRLEIATTRGAPGDSALLEANEQLVLALLKAQAELGMTGRTGSQDRRSADRDALTGLPNRLLLLDQFAFAIAAARRKGSRLGLLFIDLDGFKSINDTLGHGVGDIALRHAAACLLGVVRRADVVSRHGGDEFLVLLTELVEPADAALVAAKMLACLGTPERIGDHVVRLGASIGISLYPDDGTDPEQLIQLADAAMYQAKRQGSGRVVLHDPDQVAIAFAGEAPVALHNITRHDSALARQELRQVQLQEANEHLLLAALGAQELQTAAERAQGDQTAFLAVVAHELRNPLTPIRTAAALMCKVGAGELPRLQAVIERQVDHVARLVGDLLDLSRFHAGKLRLKRRIVDVCTLVPEALDTCRPAMDARVQSLRVDACAPGLFVDGDPVRLVQVLCNLLDNASKYTPQHGAIALSLQRDGASLVLTVADNGIGIRPEVLPNVFHPFVQDAHATDFHSAGLGIGLTVVRELVEAHGGTVEASSDGAGLGSRFVVRIPLAPGGAQEAAGA
jgi:diguanylate cyclase (GGDEF)-like protein